MDKIMNKQNIGQTVLAPMMAVFSLLFMSTSAMAHPGHDHGANESMLVHVLFYGAIAAAVAFAVFIAYRQFSKKNEK